MASTEANFELLPDHDHTDCAACIAKGVCLRNPCVAKNSNLVAVCQGVKGIRQQTLFRHAWDRADLQWMQRANLETALKQSTSSTNRAGLSQRRSGREQNLFIIHRKELAKAVPPLSALETERRAYLCQTCPLYNTQGNSCKAMGEDGRALASFQKTPEASCPTYRWGAALQQGHYLYGNAPKEWERNLLCHIYPLKSAHSSLHRNLHFLRKYWKLFNGVKSVGVVIDSSTENINFVQNLFDEYELDWTNIIVKANVPKLREGVTFVELMRTIPQDAGFTFYAHAKGVRYPGVDDKRVLNTSNWSDLMYYLLLEDWASVYRQLEHFPILGTMKRYGLFNIAKNFRWHYSGTYYWFCNPIVFSRNWAFLHDFMACVEAWPANIFPTIQGGCHFHDNCGDLYSDAEWEKLIPELKLWCDSRGLTYRSYGTETNV